MSDFTEFLRSATSITTPELCPEVSLHLAADLDALWQAQESWLQRHGLPPPFWGVAWVGGQGLARYTLDHADLFRGRAVLDLGSGSGLCAIAAAKAGARRVEAVDLDAFALQAIAANAVLNGVEVATLQSDLIGSPLRWDVILAADLWYERFLAERVTPWLRTLSRGGTLVLLGDCGRAFFPRQGVEELQCYAIRDCAPLERESITTTRVWRMN